MRCSGACNPALVGALGAVSLSGYEFPKADEYARKTAHALEVLQEDGPSYVAAVTNPPVGMSSSGLAASLQAAAGGAALAQIAGPLSSQVGSDVQQVVAGVLNMTTAVVAEVVGQTAADAIGGAVQGVPILGQLAMGIMALFESIFVPGPTEAQIRQKLQEKAYQAVINTLVSMCSKERQRALDQSGGTGPLAKRTPADLFRPVAYAYQAGSALPLTPASIYVLLCGDQSPWFSTTEYEAFLAETRSRLRDPQVGLPLKIRRKMWSLIEGIMAAVENPELGAPFMPLDGGRSLWPILQDLVLNHYVGWNKDNPEVGVTGFGQTPQLAPSAIATAKTMAPAQPTAGKWTKGFIHCLWYWITHQYTAWAKVCSAKHPEICAEATGTCSGNRRSDCGNPFLWYEGKYIVPVDYKESCPFVDARKEFYESVRQWQQFLLKGDGDKIEGFWDPVNHRWRNLIPLPKWPAGMIKLPAMPTLVLSANTVKAITAAAEAVAAKNKATAALSLQQFRREQQHQRAKKAAAVVGGAAAGGALAAGLAFLL